MQINTQQRAIKHVNRLLINRKLFKKLGRGRNCLNSVRIDFSDYPEARKKPENGK